MFLENSIKETKKKGWIEVIAGSMFSGKTEELIRRLKRAKVANQRVEIFKPEIDVRYSDEQVISHDANSIMSTPVSASGKIMLLSSEVDVVGIDEAQFFDRGLVEVCNIAQFSHRKNISEKIVLLGEQNVYEPLCRSCFFKVQTNTDKSGN